MSPRTRDQRRVKDVQAKPRAELAEFYGDPELLRLGYVGEAVTYHQRVDRIHALARQGRGPLAEMRAAFAAAGYRSDWRPYCPPGYVPPPRPTEP